MNERGGYQITVESDYITGGKDSIGIISKNDMNWFFGFKIDARFNFTRIGFRLRRLY